MSVLKAGESVLGRRCADQTPVKYVVILIPLPHENIMEEFAKIGVRHVVEAKSMSVVQEDPDFIWGSTVEKVSRGGCFLFHNAIVFLLLGALRRCQGRLHGGSTLCKRCMKLREWIYSMREIYPKGSVKSKDRLKKTWTSWLASKRTVLRLFQKLKNS